MITGRGKSVNNVLRNFIPKEFWHLVYIGNYNGMIIYSLSDSENIDNIKKEELNPQLEILLNELKKRHISNFELKPRKEKINYPSKVRRNRLYMSYVKRYYSTKGFRYSCMDIKSFNGYSR